MSNSLQLVFRPWTASLLFLAVLILGCESKPVPQQTAADKPTAAPSSSTSPSAPTQPPTQPDAPAPPDERYKAAAAKPSAPFEGEGWESLFDGQSLRGWRETQFAGRGEVAIESGLIALKMGDPFTGINYTNEFPKMNYEIALDAMRVSGSDFFCGLTVPVVDSFCSMIVGGWGGALVGISSLDGMDASENETTKYVTLEQGRWYRVRLRITPGRIEGWIDNEKLINVLTEDRKVSTRPGDIEMSKPMGIASWQTSSALRNIKVRTVEMPDGPPKKF